jgi:selenocysteine lyase/cysteine desulfurase
MTTALTTAASVETIRSRFPALERRHKGAPVAYFDGPGGTQVPRSVVDAMSDYLYHHNANTHWHYPTSEETDAMLAGARETLADFLGAAPAEIAFGANMTTLTFHLARALGRAWGPGDEVIVTELDHHANVAPWHALARDRGVTIRTVPLAADSAQLDWNVLESLVGPRTRLLAIGAGSNALGTITDVARAATLVHAVGGLCFVDAVHYAPHFLVDVRRLDCDFLACSAYKFYGSHVGVLYGRTGLVESLDERLARGYAELHLRAQKLMVRLWRGLGGIAGVRLYGSEPGLPRTPTIAFTVAGRSSEEVATRLGREGVFVSNGDFYAATVVERLGLAGDGLVRAGCACYTTAEEVDRLVQGVGRLAG